MPTKILLSATALSLALVSAVIVHTSSAAFIATVDNTDNTWETGSVDLGSDAGGSAMFTATDLVPGSVETRCIVVTYQGSVDAEVRLYGGDLSDTNDLADDLVVTVEQGSGGEFGDCDGFASDGTLFDDESLSTFATNHDSYANGLDSWSVDTAGQNRTYQITVELDDESEKASSEASYTFVWEAQSQP